MRRARAVLLLAILVPALAQGQGASVPEIRKEMARIRTTTNWEDPKAAAAANRKIEELSRQIMRGAKPDQFDAEGKAKAGSQADILEQAGRIVEQGEDAPMDLAKTTREEVEREQKEEKDPTIKSQAFLDELETLILNLTEPEGRSTADQIGKFKKVRMLVVVGGAQAAAYDLESLLARAAGLPLRTLVFLGFGGALRSIPAGVNRFKSLETLSLLGGGITSVAGTLGPPGLSVLHLDGNPIASVAGPVASLRGLQFLGLLGTKVPKAEVAEIRERLPSCQVEGP